MPDFINTIKNQFSREARPLPPEQKDTLPQPETPKAPEIQKELGEIKSKVEVREEPVASPSAARQILPKTQSAVAPQNKSERLVSIEKVMASGLEEIYANLDSGTQQMLKDEGEKTASQIEALLEKGKDAAKKILRLIRQWLHKIPGVNKFFLEQESKIKTDRIMGMMRKEE